jgi:hypothetical protein
MAVGKNPPLPNSLEDSASYFCPPAAEEEEDAEEEGFLDDAIGSSNGSSRFFLDKNTDDGAVSLFLHSSHTSKNKPAKLFRDVPSELIDFLVSTYYNGNHNLSSPDKYYCNLEFVSEYSRGGSRFRGHWDYRSGGRAWNDWAHINWEGEGVVPAKILMFAKYYHSCSTATSTPRGGGGVCYEAIIISGIAIPQTNTLLTKKFKLDMVPRPRSPTGVAPSACPQIPRYMTVDCSAILEPCLVFPNILGADGNSMLVVEPIQVWSDKFMKITTPSTGEESDYSGDEL